MATLAHVTAVFQNISGKRNTCNLDFEANLNITADNLTELAQAGYDGFATFLDQFFTDRTSLLRCEAFSYDVVASNNVPPVPPFERELELGPFSSAGAALPGTHASVEQAPPQVAMVTSFRGALASRRGRGRIYLPPPPENQVDSSGQISAGTYRADLEDGVNDWIVGMQNAVTAPQTMTHVVVSLTGNIVTPVLSRTVGSRVDTQRRRLPREGA